MNSVKRRDFLKGVALASVAGVGASQTQAAARTLDAAKLVAQLKAQNAFLG